MKKIYLDYAATSPTDSQVFKAMLPFFNQKYGNPSAPHWAGIEAKKALEQARKTMANFLKAEISEIIFTSGATESINLSHKGLIEASLREPFFKDKKPEIITCLTEHKAVLETCAHLQRLKMAKINYLSVDKNGLLDLKDLEKVINPQTVLVSIMYVNNEVGTIQPIREIANLLKEVNQERKKQRLPLVVFHVDITQAIQYLDCRVDYLQADLLSFSGHKIYGPKGTGALYVRSGVKLARQADGGSQESLLRSGTENIPGIIGLAKAISLINKAEGQRIKKLSKKLIKGITKIPQVSLTGHPIKRAPHIASFLVKGVEGESLVLLLSDRGIAASTVSACNSEVLLPSHVLMAMGVSKKFIQGSLRFSLGKDTASEQIDEVTKNLPLIINHLRKLAPKLTLGKRSNSG